MRVNLICRRFDRNSGQGIYKIAQYLYENLIKNSEIEVEKISCKNSNYYLFDLIYSPIMVLFKSSDVYHFLMPEVSLSILLSKRIKERSIVTIHDAIIYKIKERKFLSEKYTKMMYIIAKNAKIITTPSKQSKEDLVRYVKINEEKIHVIPWGIDLEVFKPEKRGKEKGLVVGYVGGLGKRKNVEWLLFLAKRFPDIIFKIAGVGPRLCELKRIKDKLKLNNVCFMGFIKEDELSQFYSSLDIFIFPSLYEGFGIPLLEAMACEVPYIIGTNAGIGEVLPIYKVSNFNELRELLTKIKDGKIKPLKNQRNWIVRNKFTWKDHLNKLLEVYRKL